MPLSPLSASKGFSTSGRLAGPLSLPPPLAPPLLAVASALAAARRRRGGLVALIVVERALAAGVLDVERAVLVVVDTVRAGGQRLADGGQLALVGQIDRDAVGADAEYLIAGTGANGAAGQNGTEETQCEND